MSSKICYEWLNRLQCAGVPFLCDLKTARTSGPRFRERLLKLREQHRDNEAAQAVFDDIEAWQGSTRSMLSSTLSGVPVTSLDDPQQDSGPEAGEDQGSDQESPEDFQQACEGELEEPQEAEVTQDD